MTIHSQPQRADIGRAFLRARAAARTYTDRLRTAAGRLLENIIRSVENRLSDRVARRAKPQIALAITLAGIAFAVAIVSTVRK